MIVRKGPTRSPPPDQADDIHLLLQYVYLWIIMMTESEIDPRRRVSYFLTWAFESREFGRLYASAQC